MSESKKVIALRKAVSSAESKLQTAKTRVGMARLNLRNALEEETPYTADDYRLLIEGDDSWSWRNEEAMLDDVLGDHDPETCCGEDWRTYYKSEADWKEACERIRDENVSWVEAYENQGVYAWHAKLMKRDRVTGDWEFVDAIGGFFSKGEWYGRDVIDGVRDALEPEGMTVEIVNSMDGE